MGVGVMGTIRFFLLISRLLSASYFSLPHNFIPFVSIASNLSLISSVKEHRDFKRLTAVFKVSPDFCNILLVSWILSRSSPQVATRIPVSNFRKFDANPPESLLHSSVSSVSLDISERRSM